LSDLFARGGFLRNTFLSSFFSIMLLTYKTSKIANQPFTFFSSNKIIQRHQNMKENTPLSELPWISKLFANAQHIGIPHIYEASTPGQLWILPTLKCAYKIVRGFIGREAMKVRPRLVCGISITLGKGIVITRHEREWNWIVISNTYFNWNRIKNTKKKTKKKTHIISFIYLFLFF
jgi:hypothetical protein